jgi:adenine-specific DNA-methyltransferase
VKYMGSKSYLLMNGLGDEIRHLAHDHSRLVDLFCGSGSVSWFAATETSLPTLATDLQTYATTLAGAVVTRTTPMDPESLFHTWTISALEGYKRSALAELVEQWSLYPYLDYQSRVEAARNLCEQKQDEGTIWNAYGGYYFSPHQALLFDQLLMHIPDHDTERLVCLAALISAASTCAAAPGHTAQPFQPTETASRYIEAAWSRDPVALVKRYLDQLCAMYASKPGEVKTGDANVIASILKSTDLVVIDPPYSAVQYSRFYHVLETIARGYAVEVAGRGRYPTRTERPQSSYSRRSESHAAVATLLETLANQGATVLLTYPVVESSNGLSGTTIIDLSKRWFDVGHVKVANRFSTMGGNQKHRAARSDAEELIITMRPKRNHLLS